MFYHENVLPESRATELYKYLLNSSWTWGYRSHKSLMTRSIPKWSIFFGGPSKEAERLKDKVKDLKLENCIEVLGRLSQKQTVSYIQESDIGILINSSINEHSVKFTSPLKYFEYLYGGCKVLAVDFPSHRSLPYSNKINFFTENDNLSFVNSIVNFENNKKLNKSELNTITTSFRAKNIVNFIF